MAATRSKSAGKLRNPGRPFQRGHDARRNLRGRPTKALSISSQLRDLGEADDAARAKRLAEKIWDMAMDGDSTSIRTIFERLEGLPSTQASLRSLPDPDEFDMDRLTPEQRDQLGGLLEIARIKDE